ncbi:MAG: carbamoyltransferase HypF [Oscillatoria sp. PMC 1050.18]|nr:carbamoyltransferase HypF [Oscillatoria sp. PMC 1050.18]
MVYLSTENAPKKSGSDGLIMMANLPEKSTLCQRLVIHIQGVVQGVGFRPFIYCLATELELKGWVNNSPQGVTIEVEGNQAQLKTFLAQLDRRKPDHAEIHEIETVWLPLYGYTNFEIRPSETATSKSAVILPDLATCPQCLAEIFNPENRRYRYPFTNCTHCGPRYSIIQDLPYDRPNTTMRHFPMCEVCQQEYENPLNRRFHAQPNACPVCGPYLSLWDNQGNILAEYDTALQETVKAIREGKIVAVKGLGGFHLVVDGRNNHAVRQLRERKQRPDKPLALMYPTLDRIKQDCQVSPLEAKLLQSREAPIVLLRRLENASITFSVAPGNPYLGVMLPYTPLHHLLLAELGFPIVATSGNLSQEPICTENSKAVTQLGKIADFLLVHNRPIARPVDDSILRVMGNQELVLRRGRGYAPLPIKLQTKVNGNKFPAILAVGGHLKNTVALSHQGQVLLSQHIGDLETPETLERFRDTIANLQQIYNLHLDAIATDFHPDYQSTQFAQSLAQSLNIPCLPIQHHFAHVLSCMAENNIQPPVFGVAWDGTGYGLDGTIWGGEFLLVNDSHFQRVAHLRPFPLPGGEKASQEPRRSALGLLYQCFGEDLFSLTHLAPIQAFSSQELTILQQMLRRGVNTPMTSSIGRLFDAIASLLNLTQITSFEGQGAMQLEFLTVRHKTQEAYPVRLANTIPLQIDWQPMVEAIVADIQNSLPLPEISTKFHHALIQSLVKIAHTCHQSQVILTGGCFQNQYLLENSLTALQQAGFSAIVHHHIPPNDGGIALGQILGALSQLK